MKWPVLIINISSFKKSSIYRTKMVLINWLIDRADLELFVYF